MSTNKPMAQLEMLANGAQLFYKNTGLRSFNTVTLRPPRCTINGKETASSRETILAVRKDALHVVHCYLLSTAFFFYYQALSNCRDLNPSDIAQAPFPKVSQPLRMFQSLSTRTEADYTTKGRIIRMNNKKTGLVELESVTPARSKDLVDEIDRLLAREFGFSEEQLDYIINYDIKYRMGRNTDEDEE